MSNGPTLKRPPSGTIVDRNVRRARLARALGLEQRGGERRRIDRHLQPRPQVEQRAEMILVRVGEHDAGEVVALLDQIADVGQDQIDAGQMLFRGERHAEIDRQPVAAGARRRGRRSTRFMPISPTPPSGANTSSCCGAAISSPCVGDPRSAKHFAGGDRLRRSPSGEVAAAAGPASSRPRTRRSARAPAAARGSARRARPRARASRRGCAAKPCAAVPLREARAASRRDSAANSASRRHRDAGARKIGRRIVGARPDGCAQLTPMPMTTATGWPRSRPRSGCRRACRRRAADRSAISASSRGAEPRRARARPHHAAPAPRRTTVAAHALGGAGSVSSRLA